MQEISEGADAVALHDEEGACWPLVLIPRHMCGILGLLHAGMGSCGGHSNLTGAHPAWHSMALRVSLPLALQSSASRCLCAELHGARKLCLQFLSRFPTSTTSAERRRRPQACRATQRWKPRVALTASMRSCKRCRLPTSSEVCRLWRWLLAFISRRHNFGPPEQLDRKRTEVQP